MEMPFFYLPEVTAADSRIPLDEASANHCLRVLRKRPGDKIIITNGQGLIKEAAIEVADKKQCIVAALSTQIIPPPAPRIGIGISFTKNASRIEWFLEKATEIGISHIYPIMCQRTEKTHYKFPRFRQIIVSAMLQSQQAYLPVLHDPVPIADLIEKDDFESRYMAHCEPEEKKPLAEYLLAAEDSLLLIGPEGDFTPEEIELAKRKGFVPVSLGNTRLRTETAGVVGCTLLNLVRTHQ